MNDAHSHAPVALDAAKLGSRPFRYFDFMMAAFVTIMLLSNVIGAEKRAIVEVAGFAQPIIFGAGILFFPIGYVLGDILTEVYGYARARRCIWAGTGALLFMALMSWVVVSLPPAPGWDAQAAYERVFGQVPRIVIASITAFWVGEFANSFVLAKMKILTRGKHLWTRTIGSTVVGQGVDSLLFYPLAFFGASGWTTGQIVQVLLTNWLLKVSWEVVLTPVTYVVVGFLKRHEGVDIFDEHTNFTPFRTRI